MDSLYQPTHWQVFFGVVVGASATLLGLLFVAASLRIERVTDSARHRSRAREALGQLLVLVVLGVFVLIPGQTRKVLGSELLVYGMIVGGVTLRLQANTLSRLPKAERARWLLRDLTYDVGVVAIPITGLSLIIHEIGGMYWLAGTTVTFFVWSSMQAWALLVER